MPNSSRLDRADPRQAGQPAPTTPGRQRPIVGDALSALRNVLLIATQPACDETVCLLLDVDYAPHTALVVSGRGDVGHLAALVAQTATPPGPARPAGSAVAVVVLATVQPGRGHVPDDDDVRSWFRIRRRLGAAGLVLADWFLIDGERAASLAEVTDSVPRWRTP